MEFQINTNNVILIQHDQVESGEYNVTECIFTFSNEYNGLTKKAVFTGEDGTAYLETIVDNKCPIPNEILAINQVVQIGVYAYAVDGEELLLRYSPEPTQFYIHQGSYKKAQNSTPPTPSEIEQLQAQITSNKNDIEEMQGDIVDINSDIADIKAEQITQNNNIQTNANNISTINEQIITINQDIDNLESTKADKSEIPTKTSDLINDSDFVSDANYVHTDNNFNDTYKNQITQNASDISNLQSNKADKSEIPTKVSQLTNDSGYITKNVDDLANYYKKNETYDKNEIDTKISSVYRYKGSVATYQDLPSTDLTIGDVYNVEEDGSNYAWTGTTWDKLGGEIDLSDYYTKTQADSLLSAKANSSDVYAKTETYNKTEVNTLLNDKVDKVQGKGLSTNDFTNEYKEQITTNQTAISNIKDGTTIDSFGDVETALNSKEDTSNKVTELTDQSTDVEYPSAKCVYDELEAKQSEIDNLEQDVEDLRGACLSVEGTGTEITLNNTAQGRLLKNDLSGRTEQEQLSGKNLLKLFSYNSSKTSGDLTVSVNEKGYITINGSITNTNWIEFIFKFDFGTVQQSNKQITLDTSKNYTFSLTKISGSNSSGNITGAVQIDNTGTMKTANITTPVTFTNGDGIYRGYLILSANQTFNNLIIAPMLEEGSTATSYEQYCRTEYQALTQTTLNKLKM